MATKGGTTVVAQPTPTAVKASSSTPVFSVAPSKPPVTATQVQLAAQRAAIAADPIKQAEIRDKIAQMNKAMDVAMVRADPSLATVAPKAAAALQAQQKEQQFQAGMRARQSDADRALQLLREINQRLKYAANQREATWEHDRDMLTSDYRRDVLLRLTDLERRLFT